MRESREDAWLEVEALSGSIREQIRNAPRVPLEIISCPLGKSVNHGGILRTAEAFRIEMVTFAHEEDHANDFSGNRGSTRWQPYRWLSPLEALAEKPNRLKIALTLSDEAVDFATFPYRFPMALVVGSEKDGIPDDVLKHCDAHIAIPMFGLMGSLNVATATGIVVQHIVRQYAEETGFEPIREESRQLLDIKMS
ncbi:MAG: hypothetical protein JST51_16465 [Armatimonadetes bacterium]|nr:hypothetical protein [Armatimonadota bacterium]